MPIGTNMHPIRTAALTTASLAIALAGLSLPASADEAPAEDPTSGVQVDDPAVVVTDDGEMFYRDVWPQPPTGRVTTEASALSAAEAESLTGAALADTFQLHSLPGASRTIYLDFDGGSLLSANSWLSYGLSTLLFTGWSLDGSAAFSDAERVVIQEVWARVAEDYAPFDVDVTTEEPPAGGLWRSSSSDQAYGSRVAFTNSSVVQSDLCGGGCGGLAWIGTFDSVLSGETRSPAWVFPSSLGNRAKSMAEAASHEVGHNLGLGHDGTTTSSYYSGSALWGPLMGSPYSSSVTQWSKGDYTSAGNHEDDFAVAQSNGIALRADEAGATPATAAALDSLAGGVGRITSRADVDWYAVTGCDGSVTAQAAPPGVGANLDIKVELRDASGALLESAAPATSRTTSGLSGMGASVTRTLSGGPFYVSVSGVGSGSGGTSGWSTGGYDDYGSVGTYLLGVTGCTSAPPPPTIDTGTNTGTDTVSLARPGRPATPGARRGARGGARTITTWWSAPSQTGGAAITGYRLRAFKLDRRGRVVSRRTTAVLPASMNRVALRLPRGRWVVRVRAANKVGWGRYSPRSRAVRAR